MRKSLSIVCLTLVLQLLLPSPFLLASKAGLPVSFSAMFLQTDGELTSRGRYFAGPEGIRMEDHAEEALQIVIVNFAQRRTWILASGEKKGFELDFHPEYAGARLEPCRDPHASQRIGEEIIDGRLVEKWNCEDETTNTVWFDPRLRIAIQTEGQGHRFQLQGIEEKELPVDLFELPPGYEQIEALVTLPPPDRMPDPGARWRWLQWRDQVHPRGLSPEQLDEVVANLEVLTELLREQQVLVEEAEILPSRSNLGMVKNAGVETEVASYELNLSIHRPRYLYGQSQDRATLSFQVNSPWVLPTVGFSIDGSPIHMAASTVGAVAGVAIHRLSQEKDRVQETFWLLSASNHSPWLPVLREDWIRTLINDRREKLSTFERDATEKAEERQTRFEQSYAAMKRISADRAEQLQEHFEAQELGYAQVVEALQANDHERVEKLGRRDLAILGRTIRKLEKELEEMPPKLRSSQAYCCEASPVGYFAPPRHATRPSLMVEPDDQRARALVIPNPDFLRDDLPATAMQSITVRTRVDSTKKDEWEAYLQAVHLRVDWQVLVDLLQ